LTQETCTSFFKTMNTLKEQVASGRETTRKFYSNLIKEAEEFESFLDMHGARENRTWAYFTEFVASIRNLGKASFYVKHLYDRYPFYHLRDPEDMQRRFYDDATSMLNFLNHSLLGIYEECVREGKKNKLMIPAQAIPIESFQELEAYKRLPKNAEDEVIKEEEDRIIDLLEKVCSVAKMLEEMKVSLSSDQMELKRMIPSRIDEKKARLLLNHVHTAQSEFDTYIKNTTIEQKHEYLKHVRGYISMPLHLLESMIWLIHFYERHEDEIRKSGAKSVISSRVQKKELLSHIINFCFFYCLFYMKEGEKLSRVILKSLVKTVRYDLPVPVPLGFHARPSTYVSLIVRRYGAEAWLFVDHEKYDAKSVMSLLQAGGMIADKGYQTVVFEGNKQVLDDLKILAAHNYCEECGIPPELDYLRSAREG
ncbi:MAG: HPr family phosphocarrier protein, partial [Nitrospinaceae bacterium]